MMLRFKKIILKKEFYVVFVIILIASFMRLYRISDYMTFLGDEGRDVLVVKHILEGNLTLLGPTASVGGFFLGPIYYYLMVPFLLLFNYNPVGPAVMVAIFGIATVFLVYKIGSQLFESTTTGIVASLLYAITPIIIAYSRSSWNPNLMPFFSSVTLLCLYKAVTKKKLSLFVLVGILLGITLQLHYLATFLGVIIALYIIAGEFFFEDKKNKYSDVFWVIIKKYTLVFLGFLVGLSPFLAFEVRHGFPNIQSIVKFIFKSGDVASSGAFFQTLGNVFFRLFGRLVTNFPPPEQVSLAAHPVISFWYMLTLILGIASVVLFLYQFKTVWNKKSQQLPKLTLFFLWFFVTLLLFGLYRKNIYDYYFGLVFPLPFILVGNLFTFLFKQKVYFKVLAIVGFGAIFYINIIGEPFRYPPNRQYLQVKNIAKYVLSKTDNKPFNFALITGGNSDHAYRYFFELENKKPVTILNQVIDPERKSVTEQLLIVCETLPCQPLGNSLWEVAGFGRAEIAGEWPVQVVQVYRLTHYKGKGE